jgi:hypothetical protein
MPTYARLSARRGSPVDLNVTFYRGGVPTDPYAIRRVEIYRTQVLPHNLVATILLPSPCSTAYPSPVEKATANIPAGSCGTDPQTGVELPGGFVLEWDVPEDAVVPDVYFDVWYYYPTNPCELDGFTDSTDCDNAASCHEDIDSDDLADYLLSSCNRFWVYSDSWVLQDDLTCMRVGFEPLDQRFRQPEVRPLEVGMMPLPLYDYDYNFNTAKLPQLTGSITIETQFHEVLVNAAPMTVGIRQGSYRSNPFVMRYLLDTTQFIKGTYKYRVTVTLPDGTTRTSNDYILTIS